MDNAAKQPWPIIPASGPLLIVAALAVMAMQAMPELAIILKALLLHTSVGGDLPSHYAHADMAFNRHISPYDWDNVNRYPTWAPALYPVFVYALFWPLTLLPTAWASLVYVLAMAAIFGLLVWLLLRHVAAYIEDGRWTIALIAVLAGAPAIGFNFYEMQVNLHIACLVVVCILLATDRRNDWLVGILLGIALLLKFYFILLLAVPLLRGDWRMVSTAVAILALALVTTTVFVPLSIWRDWWEFAIHSGYTVQPAGMNIIFWYQNQSLNGYIVRLIGTGDAAKAIAYGLALSILSINLGVLWIDRRLPRTLFYPKALLSLILVVFMIGPLSWLHYLIYQIVVVLWLWADLSAAGRVSQRRRILLLVSLVLFVLPWPMLLLPPLESYFGWLLLPATFALWLCCLTHRPHGFGAIAAPAKDEIYATAS